ncbi:MAG: glucose-6-phosphate dehydrogenase [Gammaproteobacteria bacterium]|jgi:glucose-6-phosphate 1-dehydrogenase
MFDRVPHRPVTFVLFGAAGDLSHRLILPALYALYHQGQLPDRFALIGTDRTSLSRARLAAQYRASLAQEHEELSDGSWRDFADNILYLQGDLGDHGLFARVKDQIHALEKRWGAKSERVFYFATPPGLFGPIADGLASAGLHREREHTRIVVEKPLASDLESFLQINAALGAHFHENQIYRIDHFLGKETVQNILALRFANPILEPVWNRNYVDHIVITVAETLGVEHRASYYEHAGALRDMVQNHLLQLLCLVAMEPPAVYEADDIRNRKMDVMHALRPIPETDMGRHVARGQYAAGWIGGEKFPGYRDEPGVRPDTATETYAALKLYVDNWRWQDVPFYLRTGKRMAAAVSEISMRFRPVPHRAFPNTLADSARPVSLILRLQPDEGIRWRIYVKEPGTLLRLRTVNMDFSYRNTFKVRTPSAYETLLRDLMAGDASLFMRGDQVEAAWRLLNPVLDSWAANPPSDFPNYTAGTWGPESAEALIAADGNAWYTPEPGDHESD